MQAKTHDKVGGRAAVEFMTNLNQKFEKEPHTMKRFVVLSVTSVSLALSASAAAAAPVSTSAEPSDYNPGCEQMYQAGKPVVDPLIQSPLKALFGPIEAAFCGEQKHVPS